METHVELFYQIISNCDQVIKETQRTWKKVVEVLRALTPFKGF
jgi:hypothetical protein